MHVFAAERGACSTCSYPWPLLEQTMRPWQSAPRENTVSIQTLDKAAQQDSRQPMNSALLRVLCVAAFSVVFALIDCAAQVGAPSFLTASSASNTASSQAQAGAAVPADSFDHRYGTDTRLRRN